MGLLFFLTRNKVPHCRQAGGGAAQAAGREKRAAPGQGRQLPAGSAARPPAAFTCTIFYRPDRILYGRLKLSYDVYFDARIIYSLVLFCLQPFQDVNAIILQYSKR